MAHDMERFESSALDALIADMFDTMRHSRGVGLAAPQIGVSQRVIVFEFQGGDRAPDTAPIASTVLINPVITEREGRAEDWEGCLSLPGLRGWVPRATRIHYIGRGRNGERLRGVAEGFHARIIQHEIDHLDGVLYTDVAIRTEPYERPS